MSSFEEVLGRALEDPEVRAAWDRSQLARDVSLWLLRYRIANDLTQAELAEVLGVRQSVVARLEGGEHEPSIATLHMLAERLGTTATVAIRPDGVQVRFSRTRKLKREARPGTLGAPHGRSSPRQRRGPRHPEGAAAKRRSRVAA